MRWLIVRDVAGADLRDGGSVATLVGILLAFGVILGMAALSVDVGQIYAERRELQNGADAAALAVAADCAAHPTSCDASTTGQARTIAGQNAVDGASGVSSVCGSGASALSGCTSQAGPNLTHCQAAPTSAIGYVRVSTVTRTASGATLLPPTFAQMLSGEASYRGTAVAACALAAWGVPNVITTTIPVIFSVCEWETMTNVGTSFAAAPPYPPYPASSERAITFHTGSGNKEVPCSSRPSGQDLSGGFGWLDQTSGCGAMIQNGYVQAMPGNALKGNCETALRGAVGTVVYLPVYDQDPVGNGRNGTYRVTGFAAFYLTGFKLNGNANKYPAPMNSAIACASNTTCLYGWFTKTLIPYDPTQLGTGTDYGAEVVALAG